MQHASHEAVLDERDGADGGVAKRISDTAAQHDRATWAFSLAAGREAGKYHTL